MATKNKKYLVTFAEQDVSKETASKLLGVTQANVKEGVQAMSANKAPSSKDVLHFEKMGVSVLELTSAEAKKISTKKGVLVVEEDAEVFALDCNLGIVPREYEPEVYINGEEMAKLKAKTDSLRHSNASDACGCGAALEAINELRSSDQHVIAGDKQVSEAELLPFNFQQIAHEKESRSQPSFMTKTSLSQSDEGDYVDGYKKAMLDVFSSILDANIKKNAPSQDPHSTSLAAANVSAQVSASYIPWNIQMVKAPEAWSRGFDGSGVRVAVLDTGIDYYHRDLWVYGGANFADSSGSYMDYHGHGTHCAGILAAREYSNELVGVAPRAQLYAVKVLGNDGYGYVSNIIAGLEWCVDNGIKVASMSLGGMMDVVYAYCEAITRSQQNGVLVVAAAGNAGHTSFPWVGAPANTARQGWFSTSPIAVGAVDSNNNIASFSSRGKRYSTWNPVGCVAPGVNIRSCAPNNNYVYMSGTSMATPHVAGLAALLFERCMGMGAYWVKKQLLLATYYSHPYSATEAKGFGLIDCDRVVSTNYTKFNSDFYHNWYLLQ